MLDKFVYCPSADHMNDAKALAKKFILPIYEGALDEDLKWVDRDCASVVFRNGESKLELSKNTYFGLPSIISYFHPSENIQNCYIHCEHVETGASIEEKVPLIHERNYVHFKVLLEQIGTWRIFVFVNNSLQDSETIKVADESHLHKHSSMH